MPLPTMCVFARACVCVCVCVYVCVCFCVSICVPPPADVGVCVFVTLPRMRNARDEPFHSLSLYACVSVCICDPATSVRKRPILPVFKCLICLYSNEQPDALASPRRLARPIRSIPQQYAVLGHYAARRVNMPRIFVAPIVLISPFKGLPLPRRTHLRHRHNHSHRPHPHHHPYHSWDQQVLVGAC